MSQAEAAELVAQSTNLQGDRPILTVEGRPPSRKSAPLGHPVLSRPPTAGDRPYMFAATRLGRQNPQPNPEVRYDPPIGIRTTDESRWSVDCGKSISSEKLHAEIMRQVTNNEAGWFDRLFALLLVDRLDVNEPFTPAVVADVFEETRRRGGRAHHPGTRETDGTSTNLWHLISTP